MPEIAVRIDPNHLVNPDADLRVLLPQALQEGSNGVLTEDGYDYDACGRMIVFLYTASLERAVTLAETLLREVEILGNRFDSAVVAVAATDHEGSLGEYTIVYPREMTGTFGDS